MNPYLPGRITSIDSNPRLSSKILLYQSFFSAELEFPTDSQLVISLINRDGISHDSLIGTTLIDMEDRFFSKCYATCGIPKKYELSGYNRWRDSRLPTEILHKLCREDHLPMPAYDIKENCGYLYFGDKSANQYYIFEESSTDDKFYHKSLLKEKLALKALNDWETKTVI